MPSSTSAGPDAGFPSIDSFDRPAPQVNITGVEADNEADAELDKFQAEYPDVDELMPSELKVRRVGDRPP